MVSLEMDNRLLVILG